MNTTHWARKPIGIVIALAAVLPAVGCGSGNATTANSAGTPIGLDELKAVEKGTYEDPPSTAPAHEPGKKIYLISCGQSIPFCVTAMTGAEEAAEALGWDTTLIDSKGDFSAAGQGIRQAIAAQADGIFIYSMDCEYLKQPLQEAKDAGLPVVTAQARDCNQDLGFESTGGPELFTSIVSYSEGTLVDWLRQYGAAQAKLAVAKAGDQMKSLSLYYSELGTSAVAHDSYTKYLAANCPECEDVPIGFTFADAASGLQEKAQQAMLKHPDANVIRVDSDGSVTAGVLTAAKASAPEAIIVAAEGQSAVMDIMRQGDSQIAGGIGLSSTWEGWAALDGLVRALAGEPAVSSGIGVQVWSEGNNVPSSGGYVPSIDYASKYMKAWAVE